MSDGRRRFRELPTPVRVLLLVLVAVIVVVVLFTWVFPWVETNIYNPSLDAAWSWAVGGAG